jgi:DEAD/DEAH box helicase domain-containing protein
VRVCFGTVDVSNQTVSYLQRRISTNEIIDEIPLDLPVRQLRTKAVWYTIGQAYLDEAGLPFPDVPGAAHAAEHAAIGLLPLFATCDRWDIGGVSTALHPDTGKATIFVYDGHAGGAGFAERGHAVIRSWLRATREAIASCECLSGCPSCVQSPKCGNGNDPLDKAGAVALLDLVLRFVMLPAGPGQPEA